MMRGSNHDLPANPRFHTGSRGSRPRALVMLSLKIGPTRLRDTSINGHHQQPALRPDDRAASPPVTRWSSTDRRPPDETGHNQTKVVADFLFDVVLAATLRSRLARVPNRTPASASVWHLLSIPSKQDQPSLIARTTPARSSIGITGSAPFFAGWRRSRSMMACRIDTHFKSSTRESDG